MLTHTLITLFKRDLNRLIAEIEAYNSEEALWLTTPEISNCSGNLSLHIIGNLKWFIGAQLGNSGYIRERDLEFSQKGIAKAELINQVRETIQIVENTLQTVTSQQLQAPFSRGRAEEPMTLEYFLVHLVAHLSYHLGQINYHRRLLG